jgi:hypothetical protein
MSRPKAVVYYTPFGKEPPHTPFCGGLIAVDHATGYINVFHQVSLGLVDTINSKETLEWEYRRAMVSIKNFHTDNGTFKANAFIEHCNKRQQTISFSGVGAHHQNGVAERSIRTVTQMARAMLLHLAHLWPDQADPNLWPFALDYAVWIYNHTRSFNQPRSPFERFHKVIVTCQQIQRSRVFGSPVFVLDPRIQDGKKVPKWDPRSARGQFLGVSGRHSTLVSLVHNLNTGSITPQYHLVYDEYFSTCPLAATDISEENFWSDLYLKGRSYEYNVEDVLADHNDCETFDLFGVLDIDDFQRSPLPPPRHLCRQDCLS